MKETRGNIWDWERTSLVVIPTNIGWRSDGKSVMGAGLAREASLRWHGLAEWYGAFCRRHRSQTPVVRYEWTPLILFPVKPLSSISPSVSWRKFADPELVERSASQLGRWYETTEWRGTIAVPLVGCGNGRLTEDVVIPILRKHLLDDRFVLVRKSSDEGGNGA